MKRLQPKRLGVGAMLLVLTGGLAAAALNTAASADPVSVTAKQGVGGDGLQDVFDAFAGAAPTQQNGSNTLFYTPLHSTQATGSATIQSFDSYPAGGSIAAPGCITTKAGGPSFDRPSSSGNGVAAVNASIPNVVGATFKNPANSCTNAGVNIVGNVDFARSASGPATTGTTLTFIPFARDASIVVYYDHGTDHLASLTNAQLNSLYTSSSGTITIGGDTVEACLPLAGSAVRKNFLKAIGNVADATAAAAADAVNCDGIDQNSANAFLTKLGSIPAGTDAVFPFTAASWIAQQNGVAEDRSATGRAAGVKSANLDGLGKPETGTAPNITANPLYNASTTYGNNVFIVVPTNKVTGGFKDNALTSLFAGSTSSVCAAAAQATVVKFGYDTLDTSAGEPACGDTATFRGNS